MLKKSSSSCDQSDKADYHHKSEFGFVKGKGSGRARSDRVDLGLALLHRQCIPGVPLTPHDIAAWCGVSDNAIWLIEQRALRKLRSRLRLCQDPVVLELLDQFISQEAREKKVPKRKY